MNLVNKDTLAGRAEKDALLIACQKAFQARYKKSWLVLVGKASWRFVYKGEPKNAKYTMKWNGKSLDVYNEEGKKINEIKAKVSQDMSDAAAKKISKPAKQQG
jgi:hypothetical protein